MKRMITGIKPTGTFPHIGNLMGAMLPLRENAKKYDTAMFIPDLHALTSIRDGKVLNENIRNGLIAYLAVLGRDTEVTIFRQSDIVGITKLQWMLSCFTPLALMERAHSYKDYKQKQQDIFGDKKESEIVETEELALSGFNMGTFNYPILMAADIIGYDCDVVPVGRDQQQHLEMARMMARYFNHHYREDILKEPEAIIDDAIAVIPGLDGRKMSKSYNNYISMFESSADLKKKIATIPTDSLGLDDPKNPDTCNVFALIKTFGEKKEIEDIRAKYKKGGYGYGHAKQDLHIILDRFIAPYREAYAELNELSDEELFEPVRRGNAKMQKRLDEVLARMKQYIGV
ncbi:tryptophan--tRNA ligase [Candidatus Gracilibacteria bacterium]|nr:tryptophan--tRNA ligase [Candidatus Gracilibacteria bacterium]